MTAWCVFEWGCLPHESFVCAAETIHAGVLVQRHCLAGVTTAVSPRPWLQDQLDNMDQGREELQWLPKTLPPNVFLLVSTLPVEGGCFAALHRNGILPAATPSECLLAEVDNVVVVTQLRLDESAAIIRRWLDEDSRSLSDDQMATLEDAASKTSLPLCLKLLYDRTKRWRSFQPPEVGSGAA